MSLDDCTQYEGKDGVALVDKFQYEAMCRENRRLRAMVNSPRVEQFPAGVDLKPIQDRLSKIPKRPWRFDSMGDWSISTITDEFGRSEIIVAGENDDMVKYGDCAPIPSLEVGEFIVHAPEDMRSMELEIVALRNQLQKALREIVDLEYSLNQVGY